MACAKDWGEAVGRNLRTLCNVNLLNFELELVKFGFSKLYSCCRYKLYVNLLFIVYIKYCLKIRAEFYGDTHVHTHTCTHTTHTHTCTQTHTHTHTQHTHTHMHTHIHTHAHKRTHTQTTHTHTQTCTHSAAHTITSSHPCVHHFTFTHTYRLYSLQSNDHKLIASIAGKTHHVYVHENWLNMNRENVITEKPVNRTPPGVGMQTCIHCSSSITAVYTPMHSKFSV